MLTLEQAKEELKPLLVEGRLIIFVGSGISVDSGLPTWEEFLDHFIEFCKKLSRQYRSYDIERIFQQELLTDATTEKMKKPVHVATVLKAKMKELPQHLISNVENDFKIWFFGLFAKALPNRKHELIVSTQYPHILTSNYDVLLEEAAKQLGSPYSSLSFYDKQMIAEALYLRVPAIVHVHGKLGDVVLDKIILTSEDYIRVMKKGEPGFSFAIQSLFLTHSTLFVGYGASDPHLEDLIEEFAYYFNFTNSPNMSKNYLVVTKQRAGRILNDYKKRMRTELIIIDDFSEYEDLLAYLKNLKPRQTELPLEGAG
jgi:NAD-dependent SIR2 family protein deacetylase